MTSRFGDLPGELISGEAELDPNSNFFKKDSSIPTSDVVATVSYVDKANYSPLVVGLESDVHKLHYAYEESVADIGNGFFRVTTRYAKVPDTWYSFESINIPYLKFRGVSIIGGGGITIGTAYLFNFLNVQSIADVNFFNEDAYTSFEEKSGTINVACRVKHQYVLLLKEEIKDGNIDTKMSFATSSSGNSYGDGAFNVGYMQRDGDPTVNVSIDTLSNFVFTAADPSPKIRIASGIYAGNIYYKHTYEIVSTVNV